MNYDLFMDICRLSAAIIGVVVFAVCTIGLVRKDIPLGRRDKEKKNES